MTRNRTVSIVLVLTLGACTPPLHGVSDAGIDAIDAATADIGSSAEALIGPSGGSLELASARVDIPAGALAEETRITVTVTNRRVEAPFSGFSPVYRFEPAGLTFTAPVTVALPYTGDPETATVFWTVGEGDAFAALETRIEGRLAIAETTHFSQAFVGSACEGDCCGRGNGSLDVLLGVDNSNSMSEEQALLAEQIPRMARVFATGDIDGDGIQDVPALHSVRIGTVSSDMGTGGFVVPTCANTDLGDDGALHTAGRTDIAGCLASYPSYAELAPSAGLTDIDAFVDQVSCTAQLGIGGCGFEQQLESVAKAVTPSTAPMTFQDGTPGQADRANAGFLRTDSILAVVLLTDENDCSASDPELFDPASPVYGATDLNLRCSANPDALHATSRYVDALRASRDRPGDVVYALIGGIPADLAGADPATILADPRMAETVDPDAPSRLLPSCMSEHGLAMPPRRLVEVAQGLPGSTIQSICQDDFTPAVDAILRRVAARASGACEAP
ncbi:MAG: hypothetical protein KC619_05700 [Myxococcales bacterium]|nr:hypothetical protein [Myxococcales bacterium]